MCVGHYQQIRRGVQPTPLQQPSVARDSLGRKRCSRCREWAEESEFTQHVARADGLNGWCRRCVAASRAERSDVIFRDFLRRTYGLTVEQHVELVAAQGGVCAICEAPPKGDRRLAIDHDHSCCPGERSCGECVRGLLCSNCNTMLGFAKDNTKTLLAAADYLLANAVVNEE